MNLNVDRDSLRAALADVAAVCARKEAAPGLACVRLSASPEGLELACSDLETTVLAQVGADVLEPGACCTPAAKLLAMITAAPAEEVNLECSKEAIGTLRVRSGRTCWEPALLDPELFPDLPEAGDTSVELEGTTLARLLGRVMHAVSRDATSYSLNAVYLHNDEKTGALVAAATDGHRLARATAAVDGLALPEPVLVSARAAQRINALSQAAESVGVALDDNQISVRTNDRTLITRPVDGRFPDYGQTIPAEVESEILVSRPALAEAVKRVRIILDDYFAGLNLEIENNTISLFSRTSELGLACDQVEAEYSGSKILLGLSARYLQDVCQVMDSEVICLGLDNPFSPVRITGEADPDFLAVIMPMRI